MTLHSLLLATFIKSTYRAFQHFYFDLNIVFKPHHRKSRIPWLSVILILDHMSCIENLLCVKWSVSSHTWRRESTSYCGDMRKSRGLMVVEEVWPWSGWFKPPVTLFTVSFLICWSTCFLKIETSQWKRWQTFFTSGASFLVWEWLLPLENQSKGNFAQYDLLKQKPFGRSKL